MIELAWKVAVWAVGLSALAATWYVLHVLWQYVPNGEIKAAYVRLGLLVGAIAVSILIMIAANTQDVALFSFDDDQGDTSYQPDR